VLTKKIRITSLMRGRVGGIDDAQQHHPAIGHQRTIDDHQEHGDRNQPPVGVGQCREDFARVTLPEDERGQSGRDGGAQSRFQGVLGSVVRWRSGSCFTWYARTRNFAYGTNCFIAPTFTWHGLRQVGQMCP
jgi:hypothetical protein